MVENEKQNRKGLIKIKDGSDRPDGISKDKKVLMKVYYAQLIYPTLHPTQKLITQHTLSFLYFLALVIQRRNALLHRRRRLLTQRINLRYEIRHIEPKHANSLGLAHTIATGDSLVFNTRVPVRTYEIDIRILLKVQAFAARTNL